MSPYIVNLTNHLISKNGYYDQIGKLSRDAFLKYVTLDVWATDVRKMNPSTCGKIMGELQVGDVMATKQDIFNLVHFSGKCDDLLRDIVSACLAYAIEAQLNPDEFPNEEV